MILFVKERVIIGTQEQTFFSEVKVFFNFQRKLTLEQQNMKFAKALEEFHNQCDALETNIVSQISRWFILIKKSLMMSFLLSV